VAGASGHWLDTMAHVPTAVTITELSSVHVLIVAVRQPSGEAKPDLARPSQPRSPRGRKEPATPQDADRIPQSTGLTLFLSNVASNIFAGNT
jgi:hypothetical protein